MSRRREEEGFTLVELLIVMIIMAILMAIAIPIFLGQKEKAIITDAKSNARSLQSNIEACMASTADQSYTGCDAQTLVRNSEPAFNTIYVKAAANCSSTLSTDGSICATTTATGYTIWAHTKKTVSGSANGAVFVITKANDQTPVTRTCVAPNGSGACQGGNW